MPRRKKYKPELIMVIGPNQAQAIKNYVGRLESLNEDAKAISEDKRELKKEADSEGIDWNTIKLAVARRKKGNAKVELEDELLEMYEGALQGKLFTDSETPKVENPKPKAAAKKTIAKSQTDPAQTDIEQITEPKGDDTEIPGFLRRLAGAGDEPLAVADVEEASAAE